MGDQSRDAADPDDAIARLIDALGLIDPEPGRQIRRDARGWKVSELILDRIVLGFVRPASQPPLVCAIASIDATWRSVVILGDEVVGPVPLKASVAEALLDAWPSPGTWARNGWLRLDGMDVELRLSSLGARTALRFNGGPGTLVSVQQRLGDILALMAASGTAALADWLAVTSDFWALRPDRELPQPETPAPVVAGDDDSRRKPEQSAR